MRYLDMNLGAPGRLMLAAGFVGFGLIGLTFNHLIDGLQPMEAGPPWTWINGAVLLLAGLGLGWPAAAPRTAMALAAILAIALPFHVFGVLADLSNVAGVVSAMEILGLLAAALLIGFADRRGWRFPLSMAVGWMLVVFGVVHWRYVDAIAGMIPDWMPGRAHWPWLTGAANVAAGIGLITGRLARPASALVGAMFASWILLVHLPRLLAAPGDRSEWVAGALAFALTGVVWTVNGALPRNGEDFQSRRR